MVKLGEICEIKYGKALKKEARIPGDVQVFGSSGVIGSHVESNFRGPVCVIGRKGSAGHVSWPENSCWVIDTAFVAWPLSGETDTRWIFHMLKALNLAKLEKHAAIPGISKTDLVQELIPLPPLNEQKRIAEILGGAQRAIDAVQKLRLEVYNLKVASLKYVFGSAFDKCQPLSTVASVQSGITKGRKIKDNLTLTSVPYMAVSNVKAGYLDLTTIKEIAASASEIDRFR